MLLERPEQESGPKELRVKIRVEYHLKLHALKLLRGKRMSEAVEEALEYYFERVKLEREAETEAGKAVLDQAERHATAKKKAETADTAAVAEKQDDN